MNALKCDRCKRYYDYDPSVRYNYISFGHKDIIPNKNQITKDICPECMEKFIYWLEHSSYTINVNVVDPEKCKTYLNEKFGIMNEELDNMKLCNREKCRGCEKFGWVYSPDPSTFPGGFYTCNMMNRKVENPCIDINGVDSITPKMFLESDDIFRDDDKRVNNLYKEAEDISNSAGEEKVE